MGTQTKVYALLAASLTCLALGFIALAMRPQPCQLGTIELTEAK